MSPRPSLRALRRAWLPAWLALATHGSAVAHVVEATYTSAGSPEARQAVQDGALPAWLPAGSSTIRVAANRHNADFLLRAQLPPQAARALQAECKPLGPAGFVPAPFKRAWWPAELSGNRLQGSGYTLWACHGALAAWAAVAPAELFVWLRQ